MSPAPPLQLTCFLLVRNRLEFIHEAALRLRAALVNTPPNLVVRTILVDHASTSEAAAIMREIATKYSFEHRRYDEPAELFSHFNRLIRSANTPWVYLNHDDDSLEPDFFREFGQIVGDAHEADMFACPYVTVDSRSRITGAGDWQWDRGLVPDPRSFLRQRCTIACSAFVFRRSLFDAVGGYDETMSCSADWKFYWEAVKQGRLAVTDRALMRCRLHEASVTHLFAASLASIQEDITLVRGFAEDDGGKPDYLSPLGKIWRGCKCAAVAKDIEAWFKLFRLAASLRPPVRQWIRLLYTARFFILSSPA